MANYHPSGIVEEVACTSSNAQWAFPTALEEIRCRPRRRDLTSMFMTIGDADTLCHPQLFRVSLRRIALLPELGLQRRVA